MINDTALTTPAGDSCTSGVTFGSYKVLGGGGHELDIKRQG